jgi:hypothetical protein
MSHVAPLEEVFDGALIATSTLMCRVLQLASMFLRDERDGRCVAWRGMAWHGVAWRGVAWRGVAWRAVPCRAVAAHGLNSPDTPLVQDACCVCCSGRNSGCPSLSSPLRLLVQMAVWLPGRLPPNEEAWVEGWELDWEPEPPRDQATPAQHTAGRLVHNDAERQEEKVASAWQVLRNQHDEPRYPVRTETSMERQSMGNKSQ